MLAFVWHYWLGFYLAIGTVGTVLAIAFGYYFKVHTKARASRYPKQN